MKYLGLLIAVLFFLQVLAQKQELVMFYNVENLFDTIDDPVTNDEEFTPIGKKEWNSDRYWKKINQIAKVIIAAGKWNPPVLVGLCEVENKSVLHDLVHNSPLKSLGYEFIHEESPDYRGIDVSLLYRVDRFTPIHHKTISIDFPMDSSLRSRDILHVQGMLLSDTLAIYVNHWPSRRGGVSFSEPKRVYVSSVLEKEIKKLGAESNFLVMGDFNDEPTDHSIRNLVDNTSLYNPMYDMKIKQGLGSHSYKNEWGLLDQIMVSQNLTDSTGIQFKSASIFNANFLLHDSKNSYHLTPFRTYQGPIYKGGYSDHLPVYVVFNQRRN